MEGYKPNACDSLGICNGQRGNATSTCLRDRPVQRGKRPDSDKEGDMLDHLNPQIFGGFLKGGAAPNRNWRRRQGRSARISSSAKGYFFFDPEADGKCWQAVVF